MFVYNRTVKIILVWYAASYSWKLLISNI